MTIDESFDILYELLRGSRCATPFLRVRELFESGSVNDSIVELRKVRATYENIRKSTLVAELSDVHPADKELMQLKKRQEKASEAMVRMDELLELLAIRQRRQTLQTASNKPVSTLPGSISHNAQLTNSQAANASQVKSIAELDMALRAKLTSDHSEASIQTWMSDCYQLDAISIDHRFAAGERFIIFSSGRAHVVEVDDPPLEPKGLRIVDWSDRKRMLPIPLDKFHHSVERKRVFRIDIKKTFGSAKVNAETGIGSVGTVGSSVSSSVESAESSMPEIVSETAERDKILDMGAFTQLLDAAQRSGIVPGSGVIIQVRDCEYRLGKFNKALQMMETLYTSFVGAESQRQQRLQREEAEIASGRKKMSQRDLQTKRIQDNQMNQAIDRAKVRFQRVLEGLRGLLPLESTAASERI